MTKRVKTGRDRLITPRACGNRALDRMIVLAGADDRGLALEAGLTVHESGGAALARLTETTRKSEDRELHIGVLNLSGAYGRSSVSAVVPVLRERRDDDLDARPSSRAVLGFGVAPAGTSLRTTGPTEATAACAPTP